MATSTCSSRRGKEEEEEEEGEEGEDYLIFSEKMYTASIYNTISQNYVKGTGSRLSAYSLFKLLSSNSLLVPSIG